MMKNSVVLFFVLFTVPVFGKHDKARNVPSPQLKYREVTLSNKAHIPIELSWTEMRAPQGTLERLKRVIEPGETIKVKIGEVGEFYFGAPAKISYNPLPDNEKFKQEFTIDLPNSKSFDIFL